MTALLVVLGCVLLAGPAGLVWAAVSPRLRVRLDDGGSTVTGIGKDLVGADLSFLAVVFIAGVLSGALAWWLGRHSGPFTVVALLLGGLAASWLAARVGLLPAPTKAHVQALLRDPNSRGSIDYYLAMKSPGALVGWPVGALLAFVVAALRRPEELD